MKQILLMMAVVALVGCGKKEAPKEENRVRVQRSTPKPEPPKAVPEKPIANTILEQLKKPTGELTNADLEKLTQLEDLYLGFSQLTDVKGLEKLTQLTKLNLISNELTEVPKGLEKLTKLKSLGLGFNQLTDVKGLEKLTQLEDLYLGGNPNLTKAQIAELQKALPKCHIRSDATK